MITILLGFVMGIAQGLIYTMLYIKTNTTELFKTIGTASILVILMTEALSIKNIFGLFKDDDKFAYFVIIFISTTIVFLFIFIIFFYKDYNKTSPSNRVSLVQFLVNPYKLLNIEYDLNIKDKKEYEENIKNLQIEISELIKKNQLFSILELPMEYKVIINEKFLEKNIFYIEDFSKYLCILRQEGQQNFLSTIKKNKTFDENLKTYFEFLSSSTHTLLFNPRDDIRIHFRMLNEDINTFEEYYIYNKNKKNDVKEPLTPMSANTGIIKTAIEKNISLVKSANLNLHIPAKHDNYWKDYITMVFNEIKNEKNNPYLSMTISIHKEEHSYLLYFLNYIKIEKYIEECLIDVFNQLKPPIINVSKSNQKIKFKKSQITKVDNTNEK
jgi:hypothetical protein